MTLTTGSFVWHFRCRSRRRQQRHYNLTNKWETLILPWKDISFDNTTCLTLSYPLSRGFCLLSIRPWRVRNPSKCQWTFDQCLRRRVSSGGQCLPVPIPRSLKETLLKGSITTSSTRRLMENILRVFCLCSGSRVFRYPGCREWDFRSHTISLTCNMFNIWESIRSCLSFSFT